MKNYRRIGALILTAVFAASVLCGCSGRTVINAANYRTELSGFSSSESKGEKKPTSAQEKLLDGFAEVAESNVLKLFFNEKYASVAVFDNRSGKLWFSNDPLIGNDSKIDTESLEQYYAQLYVDFIDGQNSKQVNSYTLSVKDGNFEYKAVTDGITVTYTFVDNAQNPDDTSPPRKLFTIPVEYKISGESLTVSVPMENVKYEKDIPPLTISLLPHFGACTNDKSGYLFIPDGSGALINFDASKYSANTYYGAVYGNDDSLNLTASPAKTEQTVMPVFGVKSENNGFIGIIEDAAAIATVNASRAGAYSSYNEVYAAFTAFSSQIITIGDLDSSSKTYGAQKTPYGGTLRVRYSFLTEDCSDYSGMAVYYRNYLKETQKLEKQKSEAQIPLNLELIGAIDKLKSVFGIRYTGTVALTKTDEAEKILREIKAKGINDVNLCYTGWFNGGLKQEMAYGIDVLSDVGGKKGLAKLQEYTKENGVGFYPSASVMTAVGGSSGFSKFSMASRQIDQKDALSYTYDKVTQEQSDSVYILSPSSFSAIFTEFNKNFTKLGISGLCISDIASRVNADYTAKATIDRETSVNIVKEQLKALSGKTETLMIRTGNAYAVPFADVILAAPFDSSNFEMVDETVPFFQIVYHGSVNYSGSPINMSYDYETELLKTVEYGGSPYFQLMAADGSAVKNTDYDEYCSSSYGVWKDSIISSYEFVNEALLKVCGEYITHHDKISEGVFSTTYENGVTVTVNYNTADYNMNGETVKAGGYLVTGGDSQ